MSAGRTGRLDIFGAWPAGYRAMQTLEAAVSQADLDPALLELGLLTGGAPGEHGPDCGIR